MCGGIWRHRHRRRRSRFYINAGPPPPPQNEVERSHILRGKFAPCHRSVPTKRRNSMCAVFQNISPRMRFSMQNPAEYIALPIRSSIASTLPGTTLPTSQPLTGTVRLASYNFAGGKQHEKSGRHDRFGRRRGSGFGGGRGRAEIGSAGKNVGQQRKSVPLKPLGCSAWGCSSVAAVTAAHLSSKQDTFYFPFLPQVLSSPPAPAALCAAVYALARATNFPATAAAAIISQPQ